MDRSNRYEYEYDPNDNNNNTNNNSLEPFDNQDQFSTNYEDFLYDPSIQHFYQPYLLLNYPPFAYGEQQQQLPYHLPENFNNTLNQNPIHLPYSTLPSQSLSTQHQYSSQLEPVASSSSRKEQDVFNELTHLAKKNIVRPPRSKEQQHLTGKGFKRATEESHVLDKYYRSHPQPKNETSYQLKIVQQPSRARMCGFGDKDRRSVVPTPILQLFVKSDNGKELDVKTFDATFLVVMCDSCLMETKEEDTILQQRKPSMISQSQVNVFSSVDKSKGNNHYVKNLVGTTVASANKLYDLEGNLGIFFVFHDLSVRTEGMFRLKFSLIDVNPSLLPSDKEKPLSTVIETVYSSPLTVYSAKKYPGVLRKFTHMFIINKIT
ncbi:velvet factor-domain-containing protein [Sporodiniella umbellata]|nr:velvet factor-domain-containing protein [Sporodiniella umbellata]